MKIDLKVPLMVAITVIAGIFVWNLTATESPNESFSISGQGLRRVGIACPTVTRADGTVEELECSGNYLMDEGKNFIMVEIGNGTASTDIIDTLFIGNGTNYNTNLAHHTDEINETSLVAQSVTGYSTGTGNWSFDYKWTNTGGQMLVNTTGLNCSACSEDQEFFAGANFSSSVTLDTNDELNVTWYVFVT